MNIEQLKNLINQSESVSLEFKSSTTQLKAAFETVCAFLNTKGGIVLLGVKNNGQLTGQDIKDATKQEIANEIRKIEPAAQIEIDYVSLESHKQIIAIEVIKGNHPPYCYDGRPFERHQSSTVRMTQQRYEQLIVHRGHLNHAWEDQIAHNYNIDDLAHDEIRKTIKEGCDHNRIAFEVINYDIEHILRKLGLLSNGQPTNAAVVLFAKDITNRFTQCAIKLARFRGRDKLGDFIDNQWITGNAFQILRAAFDFISRHLPIAGYFEPDHLQRIDQPAVPPLALREALINAICHREYGNALSSTIMLAIYDDRLELWNAGELPPELQLEDLKITHNSHPRNKNISTVFYKRGWIESWGTGTLRMIGYCRDNNTPEPEFEQYSGGFSIIFRFKEAMNSMVTPKTETQYHLSPRQKEIISILKQGQEMPATQIAALMQVPIPMRTLQYELNKLKQMGVLSSKGHARSFTWSITYK